VNAFLEIASALINEFQNFFTALNRYIDSNNYEDVYKIIFELFYQAAYNKSFLLENLHKNARLLNVLQHTRNILKYVNEIIDRHNADLHIIAQEMLRRVYAVLEEMPRSSPRYVILCDGLSIIDATYIAYRLKMENMKPFIVPLINPGGTTGMYKLILESRNYIQGTEISLNDIARKIADKVHAKNATVFREYDKAIHQLRKASSAEIIHFMYKLTSKLYNEITRIKSTFNGVVVLLSDHGYDIIERDSKSYEVRHHWLSHSFSLSVIVPILIV